MKIRLTRFSSECDVIESLEYFFLSVRVLHDVIQLLDDKCLKKAYGVR